MSFSGTLASTAHANPDQIADAIRASDEAIMKPGNYDSALALATAVQQLGAAQNDPALESRGFIRMGFLCLHFGDWGDHAGQYRRQAANLIEDLPDAHLAHAEVMMFEGYLSAMYLHQTTEGIAQLHKSVTIARALPDDSLMTKAFYLLGRVLPYDAQDRLAFECLHRSAQFARQAGMKQWEFVALKRAAAFNSNPSPDIDAPQRLAQLAVELGVGPAFEDLPTTERVEVATHSLAQLDLDYEQRNPVSLQRHLDGLEAAKWMIHYCLEREEWDKWTFYVYIADRAAKQLQSSSDVRQIGVDRGAGLARQGKVDEALDSAREFLEHKESIKHYGALSQVYAYLARQAGKGGDAETAYKWFGLADEYKIRQDEQLRTSLTKSADDYFANEMEARKLRSDLRGREETLARSQAINGQLLIGAGLCLVCIWFWQRARQHRIAQSQLQKLVDEQTESLRAAKDLAERANKAKTDFLARVNHELRNPLTALVGSCEVLGEHMQDDAIARQCSDTITACSLSLVDVIDDILDFTQIESGELSLRPGVFSLSDLMRTVQSITRTRLGDGVKLDVLMGTDVPQQIRADEAKLRQVLINLAINAARHTDRGYVRLECRLHSSGSDNQKPRLVLAVVDSGAGMSKADQLTVFSQYKTHSDRSNIGLGLYISRAFVECMGGTIGCSSRLNEGSTFTLEVPFEPVEPKAVQPATLLPTPTDGQLSFLVVDDEDLNRETIEMLLSRLGHQATATQNWAGAESVLTSRHVDVVLLDLQMPEMSGYQVLERIRQLDLPRQPSIIALTGDATRATRERTVAAGFSGFLAKPFRIANLLQAVDSLPGLRRAA